MTDTHRLSDDCRRSDKATNWPDPEPLKRVLKPVQPFDLSLLPDSLRPWVSDLADRMQCPPDFIAVTAMVAMAAVIGKKVAIRPKAKDDWRIVVNLWGLLIGRPSVMKTPALNEGLKFLERLETMARDRYRTDLDAWRVEKEVQTIRVEGAKTAAKRALKGGRTHDAKNLLSQAMEAQATIPTRHRYMVTDTTVEKLGELLNQNANGLLLKRDEIVSFLRNLDREDRAHERGFYLEAFNGDGRYTYDRIGRGTIEIESVTLSMIGTIQPGRLVAYTHAALSMDHNDDGLIQRFQLAVYPDTLSQWRYRDRGPDREAQQTVWDVFQCLDTLTPPIDPEEPGQPFALRFSAEAQTLFISWLSTLEKRLRADELHPAMESHLTKYRSLAPSLALILHLAEGHAWEPVGVEVTAKAFAWCTYLQSHMSRIYGAAVDQARIAAGSLLAKIVAGKLPSTFSVKDVQQKGWSGLDTTPTARAALEILVDHAYLYAIKHHRPGIRGRPSLHYLVNPKTHRAVA